ncbi:MAG: hypothetical protein KAY37_05910 [Phycisphaerae bacterium]|nr:hypothetical protein [Phycisphaerae bacterium]
MLLLLLSGCAGGQFGSELSQRPKARPISKPEGTTLRLPRDQEFNIHLSRDSTEPGLDGEAEASATARAAGEGEALAAVTGGGKAEGIFWLGQALTNATTRQTDFDFKVHFEYEFEAQATPGLKLPDAVVGLRLYARDELGRLLRDVILVQYSTENGATKRRASENLDFTLTLGPSDAVSVFLAGQAKVEVPDGRSASCSLKLRGLTIEVVTRPAPAVRTAGDEQR